LRHLIKAEKGIAQLIFICHLSSMASGDWLHFVTTARLFL
jgi:hypothetical protein